MPLLLICALLHMAWCQRTSGVRAFSGLHPGQRIGPHCALALRDQRRRLPIHRPHGPDRFRSLRVLRRREPRTNQVRLETPFFQRQAACRGEMCSMMPRAIMSSALSRPEKSADRTLCGLLTSQREQLAALLGADLRWLAWPQCIREPLGHPQFREWDGLHADPASALTAHRISTDVPFSGHLGVSFAFCCPQNHVSPFRQVLRGTVPSDKLLSSALFFLASSQFRWLWPFAHLSSLGFFLLFSRRTLEALVYWCPWRERARSNANNFWWSRADCAWVLTLLTTSL